MGAMNVFVTLACHCPQVVLVLAVTLTFSEATEPGQQTPEQFSVMIEKSLPYLLYLPPDYSVTDDHEWPLLVFLHGSGERGDGELQAVSRHGPPKRIAKGDHFPCVVVSPQCPKDEWWDTEAILLLIEEIQKTHRIDPTRIYLTGLSLGGYGTWETACRYPEKFAAILPICGKGNPIRAKRALTEMPVWCFHGSDDPAVPVDLAITMTDTLKSSGNTQVQLTIYEGVGHDAWTQTYASDEWLEWLFSHRRKPETESNGK